MAGVTHWIGTPRAAGFVAGGWCWAAAALALEGTAPAEPWGTELLRWLANAGLGPELLPITVGILAVLLHAARIRQGEGACCREWADAAWSLGLIAAGIAAWTWAIHYVPFADPLSTARRLAAVGGLGAIIFGSTLSVMVTISDRRGNEPARPHHALRRSYEAIV